VLLVDDDAALRRLVAVTLGPRDFVMLEASDGEQALSIAREQQPDLIILDVNMPRLDGFEVCRQLKADPLTTAIKVIILTARITDADRGQGHDVGADEYFIKPFSPLQLLNRVYALLE
jgi:two-component system phosphate regulon response regulator PhoB